MKKLPAIALAAGYLLLADHCVAGAVIQGRNYNCMAMAAESESHDCYTTVFQSDPILLEASPPLPKPILLAENLTTLDQADFVLKTEIVSTYRDHGPPGYSDSPYLFFPSLLRAPPLT